MLSEFAQACSATTAPVALVSRLEARTIGLLSNRAGGFHMITRTSAAGALLAALSLCGCATPNSPPPKTAGGPSAPPPCLNSTGSRIPGNCTAWGRTYSQTDLDQTGKTTAAEALGNLDPIVTITH
jgi:hypothetical protein